MNVLHMPNLQANLLLVSKLLSNGLRMQFHINECIVGGANGDVIAIAQLEENLYQMTFTEVYKTNVANFMRSRVGGSPVELWHCRLGHLNVRSIYALQSIVKGMNLGKTSPPTFTLVCEVYMESKQYVAKVGQQCREASHKTLKDCTFECVGPHK